MSSESVELTDCLIGLGSNLGDRRQVLEGAIDDLREHPQLSVVAVSRWYGTPAIGGPENQGDFLNGVVLLRSALSPAQLLSVLHAIESRAGRRRSRRWAPRLLDLDLLLYGSRIEQSGTGVLVPHPWMAIRPFVLCPALEVAAGMVHPQLDTSISQLWELASRPTTVIAVLPSAAHDRQAVADVETSLRDCADRARSGFISLSPHDVVGLAREQRIESMAAAVEQLAPSISDTSTDRTVIVHGWWDQALLLAEDQVQTALVEKRAEFASTIPVPNVTIGLRPATTAPAAPPDGSCQTRFHGYLAGRPESCRSPFLQIEDRADQIVHDISAVLRGFAEIDLRPIG